MPNNQAETSIHKSSNYLLVNRLNGSESNLNSKSLKRALTSCLYPEAEEYARRNSTKSSPLLSIAFLEAKSFLKKHIQTGYVDLIDTQIRVLEKEKYEHTSRLAKSTYSSTELGSCITGLKAVLILDNPSFPKYFLSSLALHEMVHKLGELRVYEAVSQTESPKQRSRFKWMRAGLDVTFLGKEGVAKYGILLDELGNYAIQEEFLKSFFDSQINRTLYGNELQQKTNSLKEWLDPVTDSIPMRVSFDNYDRTLVISPQNIHFDTEGRPITDGGVMFSLQLADDLSKLWDNFGGITFAQALLEAKVDPKKQRLLQRGLDERIGGSFFHILKRSAYNSRDIVILLSRVQEKLYEGHMPSIDQVKKYLVVSLHST